MSRPIFPLVVALLTLGLLAPTPAQGQIWKKVKEKAKETVERRAERKTEEAVDAMLDGAEEAVVCMVSDDACVAEAKASGQPVVVKNDDGEVVETIPAEENAEAAEAEDAPLKPGEGVWANYDFVPGDRILFADDFAEEYVGDFPRRLTYMQGNVEVVEWEGRRLLRGTGNDIFVVPIPEGVPEKFTLEFDLHDPTTNNGTHIYLTDLEDPRDYEAGFINIGHWRGSGYWSDGDPTSTNAVKRLKEEVVPIRVAYDEGYLKVYAGEQRIANVPRTDLPRGAGITFHMHTRADRPIYIGDIRVAAGGRERIYERIMADGKFVTRGILFDTGSARIQPESTPTLKEMGRMLERYEDLRLRIEGHTDNVGGEDTNQQLSQQRAEAVKAFLTETYGIDASRLEAVGLGESQPAAANDTPEGRQTNRRVELVKL